MKTPNHITLALSTLNQYHAGIVRADLLTLREFRASQKEKRCKGWHADTVFIKAEPLKAWLHSMPLAKADEMLASEMLMGWFQDDNDEPNPHDEDGDYITNHGGMSDPEEAEEEGWLDDAVDSRLGGGCMFLDLSTFNPPKYTPPTEEETVKKLLDWVDSIPVVVDEPETEDPIALALETLANAGEEEYSMTVQHMDGPDDRIAKLQALADSLLKLSNAVHADLLAIAESEQKEAYKSVSNLKHQGFMYASAYGSYIIARQADIYADAVTDAHGRWEELLEMLQESPDSMTEAEFNDACEGI